MGNRYSDRIIELTQLDPIPIEELIASNAEFKDTHNKNFGIITSVSGITSTLSSSTLMWMILRSHNGLSTTQHRLLLGLCIYDMTSSLSYSTFNVAVPSEMNYAIWNANGNDTSCTTLGFLLTLGTIGTLQYNAALNIYYLAVVKYEKNDEYIRTKIEPFLHAVPIVGSVIYSISLLVGKHYNTNGELDGTCVYAEYYPSHCIGYDIGETRPGFEIPCGRGIKGVMAVYVSRMVFLSIPAITMIICLGLIYRAVRKQEVKLSMYGRGSLYLRTNNNLRNTVRNTQTEDTEQRRSLFGSIRVSVTRRWSTLVSGRTPKNSGRVG